MKLDKYPWFFIIGSSKIKNLKIGALMKSKLYKVIDLTQKDQTIFNVVSINDSDLKTVQEKNAVKFKFEAIQQKEKTQSEKS